MQKKIDKFTWPTPHTFISSVKAFCIVPEEGLYIGCLEQNGREKEPKMEICNYSSKYL